MGIVAVAMLEVALVVLVFAAGWVVRDRVARQTPPAIDAAELARHLATQLRGNGGYQFNEKVAESPDQPQPTMSSAVTTDPALPLDRHRIKPQDVAATGPAGPPPNFDRQSAHRAYISAVIDQDSVPAGWYVLPLATSAIERDAIRAHKWRGEVRSADIADVTLLALEGQSKGWVFPSPRVVFLTPALETLFPSLSAADLRANRLALRGDLGRQAQKDSQSAEWLVDLDSGD